MSVDLSYEEDWSIVHEIYRMTRIASGRVGQLFSTGYTLFTCDVTALNLQRIHFTRYTTLSLSFFVFLSYPFSRLHHANVPYSCSPHAHQLPSTSPFVRLHRCPSLALSRALFHHSRQSDRSKMHQILVS